MCYFGAYQLRKSRNERYVILMKKLFVSLLSFIYLFCFIMVKIQKRRLWEVIYIHHVLLPLTLLLGGTKLPFPIRRSLGHSLYCHCIFQALFKLIESRDTKNLYQNEKPAWGNLLGISLLSYIASNTWLCSGMFRKSCPSCLFVCFLSPLFWFLANFSVQSWIDSAQQR